MSEFYEALITTKGVKIGNRKIEKKRASDRIKAGKDVWGTKKNAHSLAESLSEGQGSIKDSPHLIGGYRHFHDVNRNFLGHIFYGEPNF